MTSLVLGFQSLWDSLLAFYGSYNALVAYFDETGNPKDANIDAFAIGGCVASCEQWLAFDREWTPLLQMSISNGSIW